MRSPLKKGKIRLEGDKVVSVISVTGTFIDRVPYFPNGRLDRVP